MLAARRDGGDPVRIAALWAAVVVGQVGLGWAMATDVTRAVVAGAVGCLLVAGAFNSMYIAMWVLPGVMLTWRIAAGGLDLSYADALLVVGFAVAASRAEWRSPDFKRVLAFFGAYLFLLAITVGFNPTAKGAVEWLHRVHMLIGSLAVGSALAAMGFTRLALRLYVAATVVIGLGAIQFAFANGFQPAYPFGIHKNAAGFFLVCGLLLTYLANDAVGLPKLVRPAVGALQIAGLLACQSRASAATFVLVIFVTSLRQRKRLFVPVLGSLALVTMIWTTTQREVNQDEDTAKFNSIETRSDTYENGLKLWREEPVFGGGIRYFNEKFQNERGYFNEPHNVVIVTLAESGLVGLAAMIVLHVGVLLYLRPRRDPVGQVAFFATIAHLVDSLAGIYWVAGTGTLPWLLVGLAVSSPHLRGPSVNESASAKVAPHARAAM